MTADIYTVALPLAGAFQASNALVAAGWPSDWEKMPAKVFAALADLKGAPGRLGKGRLRRNRARRSMSTTPTRPDCAGESADALRPHTTGKLHRDLRLRRRPRQRQASADGRGGGEACRPSSSSPTTIRAARTPPPSARKPSAGCPGCARNRRPRRSDPRRHRGAEERRRSGHRRQRPRKRADRRQRRPSFLRPRRSVKAAISLGGRAAERSMSALWTSAEAQSATLGHAIPRLRGERSFDRHPHA